MPDNGPKSERPSTSTSSSLARYASDLASDISGFTHRVATLASPGELARQLARRRKQIILLGVLATSIWVIIWALAFRDVLDKEIVIAVGPEGGQYARIGEQLAERLQRNIDATGTVHKVTVIYSTSGSSENLDLMVEGKADLAIVQADALPDRSGISSVAPLYPEWVMVVVRRGPDGEPLVKSVRDLRGHKVALGRRGSGMSHTSRAILGYYGIDASDPAQIGDPDADFAALETPAGKDHIAAIVTSGHQNGKLKKLLGTGHYDLLPIELADAIDLQNRFLNPVTIPVGGVYLGDNPVPSKPVQTVSTTALLAVVSNNSTSQSMLIGHVLTVLYGGQREMLQQNSFMLKEEDARNWTDIPPHPAVKQWFNPLETLGVMATIMESLAGFKEMIVALVLIIYFGRFYWRRFKNRSTARALVLQQKQLDGFMARLVEIERDVTTGADDPVVLATQLTLAIQIKFSALDSLTHEEMRSDQRFLIFLMQCAQLLEHIRSRLRVVGGPGAVSSATAAAGASGNAGAGASASAAVREATIRKYRGDLVPAAETAPAVAPASAAASSSSNGSSVTPEADAAIERALNAEALMLRLMRRGSSAPTAERARQRSLRRH